MQTGKKTEDGKKKAEGEGEGRAKGQKREGKREQVGTISFRRESRGDVRGKKAGRRNERGLEQSGDANPWNPTVTLGGPIGWPNTLREGLNPCTTTMTWGGGNVETVTIVLTALRNEFLKKSVRK